MSIADKLTTIAENEHRVYQAGYDKGVAECGGSAEAYEKGVEDGKQAEYDRFWDTFQDYGNRKYYNYAFARDGWADNTFIPKYDLEVVNAERMFAYAGDQSTRHCLTDIKGLLEQAGVVLDTSKATNLVGFCYLAKSITRLPVINHESATNLDSTFWQSGVKSIDELVLRQDGTNTFGTANYNKPFNQCSALTHMIVSGTIGNSGLDVRWSPLDHDSLMSIINALQTKTSGTWTVTLGSSNLAKLTDAEKAIATGKGWTLA